MAITQLTDTHPLAGRRRGAGAKLAPLHRDDRLPDGHHDDPVRGRAITVVALTDDEALTLRRIASSDGLDTTDYRLYRHADGSAIADNGMSIPYDLTLAVNRDDLD